MSIVLKDGTVLPDLPEVFLSEYQYYAICSYDSVLEVDGAHFAIFANSPIIYVPVGITALLEEPTLISEQAGYVLLAFAPSETTEWEMASQSASSILAIHAPVENDDKFVWSNHDILTATSFEVASDFSSISVTTGEIYFPNSLAKPPFILPDGTELPALPDGCFDGTPYGMVFLFEGAYHALMVTQSPSFVADIGDGTDGVFLPVGNYSIWPVVDGAWQEMVSTENQEPYAVSTFSDAVIFWSNYDILYATANDDGSYTIGTEIARKSDENYRVTGGYMTSIANEARRLGGKTGGMLPAVTEATLRGVTGGEPELQEKTVTPTSAVQVVVPDEGYDGLSKVTVEAVSGGGGSMFQTSASGRIPVYQSGTAESVLDADDISFATSAVGALK